MRGCAIEGQSCEEAGQMDAEWFAGARPKRKQRSDKGSLKRKATDGRFDVMPQYVDMGDSDDVGGNPAVDDPNRNF